MKHLCIKPSCKRPYEDEEIDDYYCDECTLEKKAIAKRIDRKLQGTVKEPVKSELAIYDELLESRGGKFPTTKDLGIKW